VRVAVHFNPESLKVSLKNNNQGGNQPGGGSGRQFVGSGSSNLSVELVFDTSADHNDVRRITEKVAHFVMAKEQPSDPNNRHTPPRARFEWGSFIFEGVVDSLDETLDYFSEDGVPLRATIALKLSREDIAFVFGQAGQRNGGGNRDSGAAQNTGGGGAGHTPLTPAGPDDSVQSVAARTGQGSDWKAIAAANNIDDPLHLSSGALLNVSAGAAAGISGSAGASASASGGIGANVGGGISAGGGARAGFSAGLGGGVGFEAGASAGASAGIGASAGASAGIGASAGASAGIGVQAGVGVNAGGNASASASISTD
jgi:hypothetical protein